MPEPDLSGCMAIISPHPKSIVSFSFSMPHCVKGRRKLPRRGRATFGEEPTVIPKVVVKETSRGPNQRWKNRGPMVSSCGCPEIHNKGLSKSRRDQSGEPVKRAKWSARKFLRTENEHNSTILKEETIMR